MYNFILITEIIGERDGVPSQQAQVERAIAAAACACPDPFFLMTRRQELGGGTVAVAYYTNTPFIRDRVQAAVTC